MEYNQDATCKAYIHAQTVHDCMLAAFWTDGYVHEVKIKDAREAFKKLADIMGYKVELVE